MKRTPEEIKAMVERVRRMDTAGWVCDAWQGCNDWQTHGQTLMEIGTKKNMKFCPFCGYPISWDWERLK